MNDYDWTTDLSYPMKSQNSFRYLSAIAFFVAGFFAHSLYLRVTDSPPLVELPLTDNTRELEQEIRSLNDKLAAAQIENAQLSEVQQIHTPEIPEVGRIGFASGTISGFGEGMEIHSGHIEDMMSRQVDNQLDIYAARLNLNDEQRARLKEVMLMRFSQMPLHFGPDGGGRTEDENGAPLITQSDIDDLAADILSPEQLEEYDEMRAQEQSARSEMMATAQLTQIAPQLGLSEAQKDQVYSVYYEQSLDMGDNFGNPLSMQESRDESDALIEEILDEKQREVFRAIRDNESSFGNFTIVAPGP